MRNITIGQYIVGNSFLHNAIPKTKLFIAFLYVFILFFFSRISTYIFGFIVMFLLYKKCKIPFFVALKNFRSVAFIITFTSILNLFFGKDGQVIFRFLFLKITDQSLYLTIFVVLRIFLLMFGMAILTYTTLPLDLARSLGDLFLPLKRFKFPAGEISTMLSISIRFIPLLVSETEKIMQAQKARGADSGKNSLKKKVKLVVSILVPLLVSSFKRADDLAVAMESRCYCIGNKRTRYITFKFNRNDVFLIIYSFIFFAILFYIDYISII